MPVSLWHQNVQPPELVRAALGDSLASFMARYADTGFLLVKVPADGNDLVTGLTAALATNEGAAPVQPALSVMNFATAIHDPGRARIDGDRAARGDAYDESSVKQQLTSASRIIVPLRKRGDAAFVDRISVGRARNKDIVLRHPSISKFHGWFLVDDANTLYFTDAGSKNGTRINGVRLEARAPQELQPGVAIVLGRIECAYCPTRLLWRALRSA
jgi:FHA domain